MGVHAVLDDLDGRDSKKRRWRRKNERRKQRTKEGFEVKMNKIPKHEGKDNRKQKRDKRGEYRMCSIIFFSSLFVFISYTASHI